MKKQVKRYHGDGTKGQLANRYREAEFGGPHGIFFVKVCRLKLYIVNMNR